MSTFSDRESEIIRILTEWPEAERLAGVLRVVLAMQEEIDAEIRSQEACEDKAEREREARKAMERERDAHRQHAIQVERDRDRFRALAVRLAGALALADAHMEHTPECHETCPIGCACGVVNAEPVVDAALAAVREAGLLEDAK